MVSISLVMNGGIISKSKTAVDKYSQEEVQEQIKLAYSEWQMGQYMGETKTAAAFIDDKLEEVLGLSENDVTVTGSFKITIKGKEYFYSAKTGQMVNSEVDLYPTVTASTNNSAVTENSKYVSNNKTAVIPAGYTISNEETEQSIDNGLVIKKDENEWVWIPVAAGDLALMYTEDSTGWTMYGTSGDNTVVTKYKSNSRTDIASTITRGNPGEAGAYPNYVFKEPDILNHTSFDNNSTNYTAAGFSSFNDMATSLRDDYKNMIDSVRKYEGFYVGRYELSNAGTKKGEESLTNTNWYNLYAKCKTLGSTSAESRMIWGCQWDQICNFISTSGDHVSLTASQSYGNYKISTENAAVVVDGTNKYGSKQVTGYSEYWKANNIYDIAGNCNEWTQEANGPAQRSHRGGHYNTYGGTNSVFSRNAYGALTSGDTISSRPVLYIK